ncbi:MAG: molybdopterin synthase [Geobacteraceae bacterium GWF2_54_21]|nr:MAG: molybdopterin synthase [Geobacteraceae bacterium GWF2_54_21]HBA72134.1 molybdopterin synthase [Geobacter sp.]
MVKLVEIPIDPASVYNSICSSFSGSVVFHYAVVKKQAASDKSTSSIEYRAQGNTMLELENIAGEIERGWNLEDVLLIRRTGSLDVGEIISLVAASSPNSEDAFEACCFGISRLKKMSTITKTEKYADITCKNGGPDETIK